ncbi:hypothetical protein LZL87_014258 [Fusarium oxysporum]|uniref:Uncharacterized protein n=1 Tax=Fusarium oxysporum f. sp. rapae TaxID=485398 RepID=A0A8J5TWF4_FUSOX|nr:hypothetical protein Forpe1208_v017202 [Fusarium oxysporum f. sp. rapae]KAI7772208.1 hypothetical protein LZL87_014258 [Fusarium oxysporum]
MDADENSLQDGFSDDDLEDQLTDAPDQPSQLPRWAGLSQPSQLRPVRQMLPFLPLTEWDPDQRYDDQPPPTYTTRPSGRRPRTIETWPSKLNKTSF